MWAISATTRRQSAADPRVVGACVVCLCTMASKRQARDAEQRGLAAPAL
jgi:hypothetical protein